MRAEKWTAKNLVLLIESEAKKRGLKIAKINKGYSSGSPYVKVYMSSPLVKAEKFRYFLDRSLYRFPCKREQLNKPEFVLSLDSLIAYN